MFCKYCGKPIPEDSGFCSFCGKKLDITDKQSIPLRTEINIENDEHYRLTIRKTASPVYILTTKITCFVSFAVFCIAYIGMAPGHGTAQVIAFIIGIAAAITAIYKFNKNSKENTSKRYYRISLLIAIVFVITCATLWIVYEARYDTASHSVPQSGIVYLKSSMDEKLYSYTRSGTVYGASTTFTINNDYHDDEHNGLIRVELNKEYSISIASGYSDNHGFTDTKIIFKPESLKDKYVFSRRIELKDGYSIAEIVFVRERNFWDILLE